MTTKARRRSVVPTAECSTDGRVLTIAPEVTEVTTEDTTGDKNTQRKIHGIIGIVALTKTMTFNSFIVMQIVVNE